MTYFSKSGIESCTRVSYKLEPQQDDGETMPLKFKEVCPRPAQQTFDAVSLLKIATKSSGVSGHSGEAKTVSKKLSHVPVSLIEGR